MATAILIYLHICALNPMLHAGGEYILVFQGEYFLHDTLLDKLFIVLRHPLGHNIVSSPLYSNIIKHKCTLYRIYKQK